MQTVQIYPGLCDICSYQGDPSASEPMFFSLHNQSFANLEESAGGGFWTTSRHLV